MKKCYLCFMALVLFMAPCLAQNVAINEDGSSPDPKAILDIKSSNKGVLIPRISTAARVSIVAPKGLLVFDISTNSFWYSEGLTIQAGDTITNWKNLAATGSDWLLSGNVADTTSFLGTTNNVALKIRVNNQRSGFIDPVQYGGTFWGYQAGFSNLSGNSGGIANTAIGNRSLYSNTTGDFNTATGERSLFFNTTGLENSAYGHFALYSNTTGQSNTATGAQSLNSNTTGLANTATGINSMRFNTTGICNTATGGHSMIANISGQFNTANGYYSLQANTVDNGNVAVGDHSLYSNTAGISNTANGQTALYANTTGNYNTATGGHSLYANTTGYNNTAIGFAADVSTDNLTNATAIGAGATVNASNKVRIGNSAVTVIEGQVPFTTPSDGRFKFQVKEDVKGLDFILQLRPVTYRFDVKRFDAQLKQSGNNKEDIAGNDVMQASYDEAARIRRSGFIAQEVEKAAVASGYNFSGIIQPKTEKEHYSLSYESFVVPLVKAMQELNAKVEKLEKENETLKQLLNSKK